LCCSQGAAIEPLTFFQQNTTAPHRDPARQANKRVSLTVRPVDNSARSRDHTSSIASTAGDIRLLELLLHV
jgi:hypothetical protein